MKQLTCIFIFALIMNAISAKIIKTTYSSDADPIKLEQWQVADIQFKAEAKKPFDKEWGAVFTSSDGISMEVPGFYNGSDSWIIRFSASDTGVWTYDTYSEVEYLDGRSGVIEVAASTNPDQHGPVVVSANNPSLLEYTDGTPYFLMGYELDWLFALDYGNADLPKSKELLKHIKDAGFNHIITNVYAYDVKWPKDPKLKNTNYDYGSPSYFPFLGDNENPDFSALNTEYFDHFDEVVSLLNDMNLDAHVMIYVWNKLVNWPDMYSKADNRYFDYVIKRYQSFPNVVWDISKEALAYGRCDEAYLKERITRVRKLDAYKRLLTVHDVGFCNNNAGLVDIFSVQNWNVELHSAMMNIKNTYNKLPILNIEHGGYEESPYRTFSGHYTDPEICLRRNYLCAFASVYSTYYWQATSWNAIIHDPFSPNVNPQPKFEYYKFMTSFFAEYNFAEFKQMTTWSSALCLTNNKDTWLFYCPKELYGRHLSMSDMDTDKTYIGAWFNPLTGEYSEESRGTYDTVKEPVLPNNNNDWIYILKINP